MMNFVLSSFTGALRIIDHKIAECSEKAVRGLPIPIVNEDRDRILESFKFIAATCRKMSLSSAEHRIQRMAVMFNSNTTNYLELGRAFSTLKESIEDDIQFERFYHYPRGPFEAVLKMDSDWVPTFTAFSSKDMRFEVSSGIDCYALGHPTAAIFHFMRVAEFGLRALARERRVRLGKEGKKPIEWGTWNEIILKIDGQARSIAQKWKAGPKKDAALDFYSGAVQHFNGFKDQWRNSVMHYRREYEMFEAEIAMRQVRDFMNKLSTKIGESTKGPLKWT